MKKRIALIYGGRGCEHDISVLGSKNFKKLLDRDKYELTEVFVDKSGDWYIIKGGDAYPTFPIRLSGKSGFWRAGGILPCDVAFPLLHGDGGEDGTIQGALITAGIPVAGEGCAVSAMALDKACTKLIAKECDIPSARHVLLRDISDTSAAGRICEGQLGYPMFIKPNSLGSSHGASAVYTPDEFDGIYKTAFSLSPDIIAEELITDKRELEVALLGTRNGYVITPPGEIAISGTYGYKEKYKMCTKTHVVADVPDSICNTLTDYTLRLAKRMGIRLVSRFDYFLSGGKILLNEINTMPGFTDSSLYLAMLQKAGIPEMRAIEEIIEGAVPCT